MATFTFDPRLAQGKKVNLKRPTEIAHFSLDHKHEIKAMSDESLRYYCPPFTNVPIAPVPPVSLRHGFDTFQKHDDSADGHLDSLLATLEYVERRDAEKLDVDFVTWRGMMTKIVTALFEDEDGFEMNATCFQGTIFLEENHASKLARNNDSSNRRPPRPGAISRQEMEYWGYKFEALSMLKQPYADTSREEIESRDGEVVENSTQYCSIVQTTLENKSIILAGEVDGVMGVKPDNAAEPTPWVELKTSRKPSSPRDFQIHSKKLMKWWAQSYLIGCPTVVVGWRDQQGMLYEIEHLSTHLIPTNVQKTQWCRWNATASIVAASAFLDFLKQTVTEGGVWSVSRAAGQPHVRVTRVTETGTGDMLLQSFKDWRAQFA